MREAGRYVQAGDIRTFVDDENGYPLVVWTTYGPLSVTVTHSEFDGALAIGIEKVEGVPGDVEVRVYHPDSGKVLWEGAVE